MSKSLKTALLTMLDAVLPYLPPYLQAVVQSARWAIWWFVPASAEPPPQLVGDAPAPVAAVVRELFEFAKTHVSSAFYRSALDLACKIIVDYVLDRAWDALVGNVRAAAAPDADARLVADQQKLMESL